MPVLYIFHRDFRLHDNKTLIAAVEYARTNHTQVLPVFIFTPQQINASQNPYKSKNAVQFMIASLEELADEIAADGGRLLFLYGNTASVVKQLAERTKIEAMFETLDYTPFATQRTTDLQALSIPYFGIHDIYLTAPGSVLNGSGRPYQKFTPFYGAARKQEIKAPHPKPRDIPWYTGRAPIASVPLSRFKSSPPNADIHVCGGRREGLKLLTSVHSLPYAAVHDIPAKETTNLSAHNHYGTVGIREVYAAAAAGNQEELIRQLYWRDFYGHICASFEDLYGVSPYEFQAEGKPGYAGWSKDHATFDAWCRGETGVPIVDAAMCQLLTTGYMHNRARLIVANWLVKDKGIYWRWGERFFAQHLVDYDFAQNFGNWCWVASVLPFSQAPFRRLDAAIQAKKFDKDEIYVNRWLCNTK